MHFRDLEYWGGGGGASFYLGFRESLGDAKSKKNCICPRKAPGSNKWMSIKISLQRGKRSSYQISGGGNAHVCYDMF